MLSRRGFLRGLLAAVPVVGLVVGAADRPGPIRTKPQGVWDEVGMAFRGPLRYEPTEEMAISSPGEKYAYAAIDVDGRVVNRWLTDAEWRRQFKQDFQRAMLENLRVSRG